MAVDQIIHMEVSGILQGLFVLLALHYVYDTEYCSRMKDFYPFLESKLKKNSSHNSATYSNISALENYLITRLILFVFL